MRRLMLALSVVLAGCAGAAPTAAPTPTPTTTPAAQTQRPAADVPAILTATIDGALCVKPAADWCKYLKKKHGLYNIDARPGSITVQTVIPKSAKGKKLAAHLCAALGSNHFDENSTRLDYDHIHIVRGDVELAACNTADY